MKTKVNETELLTTPVFTAVKKEFEETAFQPVGINCKDWVMVICIDSSKLDEANALFVRQTRWGAEKKTIEFPCGTVEKSDFDNGKDGNKTAAIRELKEETGIEVDEDDLVLLGAFNPNPAYFSNKMTVYAVIEPALCDKFDKRSAQQLDKDEDCEAFIEPLSRIRFFDNAMQLAGYALLQKRFS